MTPEVKAEYDKIIAIITIREGGVVRHNDRYTFYSWHDWDATKHIRTCSITVNGTPRETSWDEFRGTFYEGDTDVHGISVPGVHCACGMIQDREMRWSANVHDVAAAVFAEMHARMRNGDA